MEQLELTFRANNQCLEATNFTPPLFVASNTVDWIVAKFDLGTNWDCWSLGAVKAIWKFKGQQYSAILNAEGECTVPHEVLGAMTGEVKVNLVASTIEDDEVVERLTTYPLYCINVNKVALIDGDNSFAITPSEYEQFVEDVQEYAQDAYDAKIGAEQAADSASESAGIASNMADTATQAKNYAVQQAQLAADAKEAAQTAQGLAESAKDSAIDAKEDAESARDSAIEAKNDAQGYAQDAERASQSILGLQATAEVDANVGTPSVSVSVSEVGGNKVMDFAFHNLKGVQGETGADGEDGADGFSPTVEVTPTTDGNEVTITDKNGEHTFEVLNGNIEDFYPFLPTDTAQGEIASFSDGANSVPMPSLIANINPIQDLHGQSSPYPAGGGKNLLPYIVGGTDKEVTATVASDGKVTLNGTANGAAMFRSPTFRVKAGTYKLNGNTGYPASVLYLDGVAGSSDVNNGATVTFAEDTDVTAVLQVYSGRTATDIVVSPMLRLSTESDTYAPYSNICPISGTTEVVVTRAGKNLLDDTRRHASSGTIWLGGATNNSGLSLTLPKGTYTFSAKYVSLKGMNLYLVDIDSNTSITGFPAYGSTQTSSNSQTFILDKETRLNCKIYNAGSTSVNDLEYAQFEAGSSATTYEPYLTPLTITTALGQTVYGGTVDVVSGKLTVDRAMKTFVGEDGEGWEKSPYNYFNSRVISGAINANSSADTFQSNLYAYGAITNNNATLGGCLIWGYLRVRLADMSLSLDEWKSSLSNTPLQVVYPLATPTVIQLTPQEVTTLLGGNTVWADSGDVEVTYKADIQRYIDKKISAVLNA